MFLQILNVLHAAVGSLLLTKLIEFLEQRTDNVDALAVADVMEFLCITDNSYLATGSCNNRILMEMSAELLWCQAIEHLLDHLTDTSVLTQVTVSRLVVCMVNALAVIAGSGDILLIDHACVSESHYLSVFDQQAAHSCVHSDNSDCKVASKLLEYRLIDLPLVCVHREKSTDYYSQPTVHKIVDTLQSVCHSIDPVNLLDILGRGKCQELVGVTWLHPAVMWLLRQKIFLHSYHELSCALGDKCTNDGIVSLCGDLKPAADDIGRSETELTELQKHPQHHFERALFIIKHRLDGCEGCQNCLCVYYICLHIFMFWCQTLLRQVSVVCCQTNLCFRAVCFLFGCACRLACLLCNGKFIPIILHYHIFGSVEFFDVP